MSSNNGNVGIYVGSIVLQGPSWKQTLIILPNGSSDMLQEFLTHQLNAGYLPSQLLNSQLWLYNDRNARLAIPNLILSSNGHTSHTYLELDSKQTGDLATILRSIGTDTVETGAPRDCRAKCRLEAQEVLEEFIAKYT